MPKAGQSARLAGLAFRTHHRFTVRGMTLFAVFKPSLIGFLLSAFAYLGEPQFAFGQNRAVSPIGTDAALGKTVAISARDVTVLDGNTIQFRGRTVQSGRLRCAGSGLQGPLSQRKRNRSARDRTVEPTGCRRRSRSASRSLCMSNRLTGHSRVQRWQRLRRVEILWTGYCAYHDHVFVGKAPGLHCQFLPSGQTLVLTVSVPRTEVGHQISILRF